MTAIAQTLHTRPIHRLLAGQTLHLFLDSASGIQIEQGQVQLASQQWVAERCVSMVQCLDAGSAYQPEGSGWVSLQALPGEAVRFCVLSRPTYAALCAAWCLRLLGAARGFAPLLKS